MPNSKEHREKHQANRQFLNTGNNGTPLSTLDGCWAAIVAFYAALHCVDRLGAIDVSPVHPTTHGARLRFLSAKHRAIYSDYNDLKTASEIARYGTMNQFNRAYPGNNVQTILIDQKLVAIENYVAGHFPAPAPAPSPPAEGGAGATAP